MIKYVKDDLLSATKGLMVHGCNCQGVMGSGVALAIKRKYPQAFRDYSDYCFMYGTVASDLLGKVCYSRPTPELVIANAFTQEFYGTDKKQYASYAAISSALANITSIYPTKVPIVMPKIGCGLGGAEWDVVSRIVEDRLRGYDVTVYEL